MGKKRGRQPNRAPRVAKESIGKQSVTEADVAESATQVGSSNRDTIRADDLIAAFALETWRLGRRIDRMTKELGDETMRPLQDSLQRLEDVMALHDLEYQTHDGQRYMEGSALEVVYIRDKGELMVVVETVQPTIRYPERILRNGQVIIGSAPSVEEV